MAKHKDYSESHPECPERILAIHKHLTDKKLLDHVNLIKCPKATVEQLKLVHPQKVIDKIFKTEKIKEGKNTQWFDQDNYECKYTKDAALLSCGGTIAGVESILAEDSKTNIAFSLVRPPGHHAFPEKPGGF